jgi:hypothetical protein
VPLAGKKECVPDLVEVDGLERVHRVLGDDREQVREQLALVWKELLLPVAECRRGGSLRAVFAQPDPHAAFGRGGLYRPFLAGVLGLAFGPVLGRRGSGQAALALLIGCASPLRNLSPSSWIFL